MNIEAPQIVSQNEIGLSAARGINFVLHGDPFQAANDLIARFAADPRNKGARKRLEVDIDKFCARLGQTDVLARQASSMLDAELALPLEEQHADRITRYNALLERYPVPEEGIAVIDRKPSASSKFPSEIRAFVEENKSTLELPKRTFDLVNESFARAYPDEDIPQLTSDDVFIIKTSALEQFFRDVNDTHSHTLMTRKAEEFNAQFGFDTQSEEIRLPDFYMVPILEGRPIFISEDYIKSMIGLQLFPEMMARFMLHEHGHRFAKPQEMRFIDSSDKLIDLAFSTEVFIREKMEDQPKAAEVQHRMIEEKEQYARDHEPAVVIDGAILILFCRDEDGEMRGIAQSGYDLNEAIIEMIIEEPQRHLIASVRKTRPAFLADIFEIVMSESGKSQATIQNMHDIMEFAPEYLQNIGLHSITEILHAYREGRIPSMHDNGYPTASYLP